MIGGSGKRGSAVGNSKPPSSTATAAAADDKSAAATGGTSKTDDKKDETKGEFSLPPTSYPLPLHPGICVQILIQIIKYSNLFNIINFNIIIPKLHETRTNLKVLENNYLSSINTASSIPIE